ncbi:hypothetical protein BABA_24610 [Neobacillus bataviensis LMG 21833]|uniref:Uncharacterized protein n=1 Tax=Neobacillus bataviensis LMG 21833 TaxID=1117379 RepID=K6DS66_9BACI|nr:hypothetical protein [Neobacillus bataviensis]EKN63626.1 hypothetical protein BABA_24610 [Neobacillus bataviensis LMG 21833]
MWTTLAVLSFLGIILFIVLALISMFKKTKMAKKMMIFAAGCFVLTMIFGSLMPQTESENTSAKIEDKKEDSKKKELKDKKKAEAQEKKEKAAQPKEEAVAKKKSEEKAEAKKEEEEKKLEEQKAKEETERKVAEEKKAKEQTDQKEEAKSKNIDTSVFEYAEKVEVTNAIDINQHITVFVTMSKKTPPGLATQHVVNQTYDFLLQNDTKGAKTVSINVKQGDQKIAMYTVETGKFVPNDDEPMSDCVMKASKMEFMTPEVKEFGATMNSW